MLSGGHLCTSCRHACYASMLIHVFDYCAAHCSLWSTLPLLPSSSSTFPPNCEAGGNAAIPLGTCESKISPAFATRGLRYLDSLPLIMDSLLSIRCKYCLPCTKVSDVSPEDTCKTSARQPAISESFCSMPMPCESRTRGFALSVILTVRRASSMG